MYYAWRYELILSACLSDSSFPLGCFVLDNTFSEEQADGAFMNTAKAAITTVMVKYFVFFLLLLLFFEGFVRRCEQEYCNYYDFEISHCIYLTCQYFLDFKK